MAKTDPLKWIFEAVDRVSGPSGKMKSSLSGVEKGLKAAGDKAGGMGKGVASAAEKLFYPIEVAKDLAGALMSVGSAVADFAGFVIKASEFKRQTLAGLTALEGSAEAAEQALGYLRALSNKAGFDPELITSSYRKLRTAGFEAVAARNLLATAADASIVGIENGPDVINKFTEMVAKAQQLGKIEAGDLAKLIPLDKLKKNFAAAKDMSATEFKAFLETVKTNDLLEAVSKTVNQMAGGGAFGAKAIAAANDDLGKQKQIFQNIIKDMFADEAKTGPLLDAMKRINALLDENSESGQKLRQKLGEAFEWVADTLEKLLADDGIESTFDTIMSVINGISEAIGVVSPYIDALLGEAWGSFKESIKPLVDIFKDLFKVTDKSPNNGMLDAFKALGRVLGTVAGLAVDIFVLGNALQVALFGAVAVGMAYVTEVIEEAFANVGRLFEWFGDKWEDIKDWFSDAKDWGSEFVENLLAGIEAKWDSFVDKVKGLANLLPDSVKKALGIASPSKVFMEIGRYSAEGFEIGFGREAANTNAVVAESLTPETSRASVSAAVRGGGLTVNVTVNVQSSGDAEADGRAIGRAVRDELVATLEQLATAAA